MQGKVTIHKEGADIKIKYINLYEAKQLLRKFNAHEFTFEPKLSDHTKELLRKIHRKNS